MIDSRDIFGGASSTSATTFLYNRFSVAGFTAVPVDMSNTARTALSAALTANTLVDLINESGSAGEVSHLGIAVVDGTPRTLRVVVIVDGTTIFDFTSASGFVRVDGIYLAGTKDPLSSGSLPPIRYTNSIRIRYASNLTETAKFTTYLAYQKVT